MSLCERPQNIWTKILFKIVHSAISSPRRSRRHMRVLHLQDVLQFRHLGFTQKSGRLPEGIIPVFIRVQ